MSNCQYVDKAVLGNPDDKYSDKNTNRIFSHSDMISLYLPTISKILHQRKTRHRNYQVRTIPPQAFKAPSSATMRIKLHTTLNDWPKFPCKTLDEISCLVLQRGYDGSDFVHFQRDNVLNVLTQATMEKLVRKLI